MIELPSEKGALGGQFLRVLFVDDSPADVELCRQALKQAGFEISGDSVATLDSFAEQLAAHPYDIVLADYNLLTWNGMEALEYLQKLGKDIPFILVTGILGEEAAAECIKRGASDYVLKDRLARLPVAIRRALEENRVRQERARVEEARFKLAAIVESSDDAIIGNTLDGFVVSWNSGAERLFGYAAEEAKGFSISMLLPSDRPDELPRILERIRSGERVDQYEIVSEGKDGKQIDVSLTVSPIMDTVGEIVGVSVIARDIAERKRLEARLANLASHDPLTDLFNRRHFQEEMERHLEQVRRYGTRRALLFLDLDRFKVVNDSFGHLVGDDVLAGLTRVVRDCLRETDIVGRQGGDEFAILLTDADSDKARTVAEHLLKAVRRYTVVLAGQPVTITASIGIVLVPEHGTTVRDLFARADRALHQAKQNGADRFEVYAPALSS